MFTFFIDPAKRNPMTSRATDEELEDEVKTWLRGAPDRCGGRALRAQRAAKRALARHSIAQRHGITHRSPASRHGSTQRSSYSPSGSGSDSIRWSSASRSPAWHHGSTDI